jgi:2-dehydropantoate 2-reductase
VIGRSNEGAIISYAAIIIEKKSRGVRMELNVGIIGVGGVGGYYGSKFCRLISEQEAQVYFIARGQHLNAICQDGLSIKTAAEGDWISHPTLATDNFGVLPVLDVCLVCVKAYDLQKVSQQLRRCISGTTAIIPLLNGIDIYERMRRELDIGRIFPACTYIGVHISAPGKIYQRGGDCSILFGRDPQSADARPHSLFELFKRCGVKYEWCDEISPVLWRKYIFIAGFGMVMASFDKTLGQVMEVPRLSQYVQAIMEEIAGLARRKGVELPADIITATYQHGRDFAYESKTSFQRDFEKADKPDERDLFADTILRMGKQFGIDTPVTRELQDLMEQRKPFLRV